jgi:hypothetical protein
MISAGGAPCSCICDEQEISTPSCRNGGECNQTLFISATTLSVISGSSSLYVGSSNTAMISEAHACCALYRARSDAESLFAFDSR